MKKYVTQEDTPEMGKHQLQKIYGNLNQDSDNEDYEARLKPKHNQLSDQFRQTIQDENQQFRPPPSQQENQSIFDVFRMNAEEGKTQVVRTAKKEPIIRIQIPLQQFLPILSQKYFQKSSIQSKVSGLKLINEKISEVRGREFQSGIICSWLQSNKLVQNLFHEDSHPQILRNIIPVLKLLYDLKHLDMNWIESYIVIGLKANDQFVKTIQNIISFVKIEHLLEIQTLICQTENIQNNNLALFIGSIIGNKCLSQITFKQIKNNEADQKQRLIQDDLLGFDNQELQPLIHLKDQSQQDQNKESKQAAQILSRRLFIFLNKATDEYMNMYYPILNKLITSKHDILVHELSSAISQSIKTGKVSAIWTLEHCLKIDFGNSNKKKGIKNQQFQFISKMVNEHLYEYLLIILAKNRFNKSVVDKILNIFVLLSKNFKALDYAHTQFIWKILGLNSKQEKERQQFFIFVKDILRNQSNFTEQSVYFIFFQVLMSLTAEWFSLKVLDCLEMLFMRLNEDLKLVLYADQTYSIQDPDLVGIDKFWYIYFYSNDSKTTKKCRQILWKLTTYTTNYDVKIKLLNDYLVKINQFMQNCSPEKKVEFCNKGFDIVDKLMQENQRREVVIQHLNLNIKNQCRNAVAPKSITIKLSEKCRLQNLRSLIAQSINPPNNNIRLIVRGAYPKGEKMTLRDLNITNNITIIVTDGEPPKPPQDQVQNMLNITSQLRQIFGSEYEENYLKFIVQKMEGNQIQKIIQTMMNQEKMLTIQGQYKEMLLKKKQQNSKKNEIMQQQNVQIPREQKQEAQDKNDEEDSLTELKFGILISSSPTNIKNLLLCGQSNRKRSWQTIKSIPRCTYFLNGMIDRIEKSSWDTDFPKNEHNQMHTIYNAYLLQSLFKEKKNRIKKYMIDKGGFAFLINWLINKTDCSEILIQQVTTLLILCLENQCSAMGLFRQRSSQKNIPKLLEVLVEENKWIVGYEDKIFSSLISKQFFEWLKKKILKSEKLSAMAQKNICQIILYKVLTNQEFCFSWLQLPLQEISKMVKSIGFIAEYLFVSAVSKLFIQNIQPELYQKYCNKLFRLIDYGFDFKNEDSIALNTIYIYDIIQCLYSKVKENENEEKTINILLNIIAEDMNKLQDQQLLPVLSLLKTVLNHLYQSELENRQLDNTLSLFVQTLFSSFLFDLQKPSKHIRNKHIRKVCYDIVNTIISQNVVAAMKIIQCISNIKITERNKEEDYLDFRNQQYVGLTNLGATCYINSLLQQIYHTKFSKLIIQKGDNDQSHVNRVGQLKTIFTQLCYSIKNVVNPRKFIKSITFYGEPINTSVQQDAMQFLLCLFDIIENMGYRSEVEDVFGGFICNEITVDGGDQIFVKNNSQPFNSLTIDILGKKNLQEALAYFIKHHNLDGDNKYFCEELGKKMKATQRCFIQKMPNILILTLKRFQYDFQSQSRHKLNDYFEFPLQLDMHRYSSSFLKNKQESSDSKYRLSGILVHSGSAQSGHYYSYIKIGEKWYQFNDRQVTEFNISANLKAQCFGCSEGKKTKSAYMLFYEKSQSNYHGVYLDELNEQNYYKRSIIEQNGIFLKSRLIYDDNFRKFLDELNKKYVDERLESFIEKLFGFPQYEFTKMKSENMVYFNADEDNAQQSKKLMSFDEDQFF